MKRKIGRRKNKLGHLHPRGGNLTTEWRTGDKRSTVVKRKHKR